MMADAWEYTFLVHLPNFIYTFICSAEINQITGGAAGYPDDSHLAMHFQQPYEWYRCCKWLMRWHPPEETVRLKAISKKKIIFCIHLKSPLIKFLQSLR